MDLVPNQLVWPARTLIGAGESARLLPECARFGRRGVLVHGHSLKASGRLAALRAAAPPEADVLEWEHAGGEPTLADLDRLLEAVRRLPADWVAGVGGGSVLDLAKAAAGLCHGRAPVAAYHDGAPLERPGIPFIAVPTTAGTGSEATVNAVLTHTATACKKSIRLDSFMARLVILDPGLLPRAPAPVIAHAGLDALTQALEAFTSRHAVWLSDALARQALALIAGNLEPYYRGADPDAPGRVLLGSTLAGLAFAMARLGVVHGIAHPLGVRCHVPHGLVCGVCLPLAVELNRPAMGAKYNELQRILGSDPAACLRGLMGRLDVRSPFAGRPVPDRAAIVAETLNAASTRSNIKPVEAADVEWLLDRLFAPAS